MAETGEPIGIASLIRRQMRLDDERRLEEKRRARMERRAKELVAEILKECLLPPDSDFAKRSVLRRREKEWKRNPPHDAHVRAYNELTPTERSIWSCPRCGKTMRHTSRPRDQQGRLLKHCGCRTGKTRINPVGYENSKRKEYARRKLDRLSEAITKGKAPRMGVFRLHDEHVKLWRSPAQQRPRLHDAHVKAFRGNDAAYVRWRVANDAGYRLNMRLRVQIRKALKGKKQGRKWEEFVGYTLADLVRHLTLMLPRGRTLEQCLNEGWHIDHIVPKSSYDLANPVELRRAWCLSNLRLLPALDNMRKGARMESLL